MAKPPKKTTPSADASKPASIPKSISAAKAAIASGYASLFRIEEIHRQLREVTPGSGRRVTIDSLMRDLGLSRNTVRRDLAAFEHLFGAPIKRDASRRTLLYTRPFELRPLLLLEPEEVLALLVAIRLAANSRTFPLGGDLVSALKRIAPMLAGAGSFGPETLDPVFSTGDTAAGQTEARHFALLCQAITQRRVVRLGYQKARHDTAVETRIVHPLHWFIRADACLLVIHEPGSNQRRNFELVRIRSVEFTGEKFARPPGFDLKAYLAGGFGRFIGEAVHEVRVRFHRDFVPLVRERPWQPGEMLHELPDGGAEVTYRVCHTGDLEQRILAAGGQAEVLSPPEVRARIRSAAESIVKLHS